MMEKIQRDKIAEWLGERDPDKIPHHQIEYQAGLFGFAGTGGIERFRQMLSDIHEVKKAEEE